MSCLFLLHEEVKEKIPSVYEKIFQILDVMPVTDRGENIDAPQILLAWEPSIPFTKAGRRCHCEAPSGFLTTRVRSSRGGCETLGWKHAAAPRHRCETKTRR